MDRLDGGKAQAFIAGGEEHEIDGGVEHTDAVMRDRRNDVHTIGDASGGYLRAHCAFVRPDAEQHKLRFRQVLHQLKTEALVLLMAESSDLAEDIAVRGQTELGAGLRARTKPRRVVAVDDDL